MRHIELIGNKDESFYQLGLKCRQPEKSDSTIASYLSIIPGFNHFKDKVFETLTQAMDDPHQSYRNFIQNFSEGKNENFESLILSDVIQELQSLDSPLLSKKMLNQNQSFYFKCPEKQVFHFIIHKQETNTEVQHQIINLNSSDGGSITSLWASTSPSSALQFFNSHGLSLSISQRESQALNPNGLPGYFVAYLLIESCKDLDSIESIAKELKTIGSWEFEVCHSDGDIVKIQFSKTKTTFSYHQVEQNKIKQYSELFSENEKEYLKQVNQKLRLKSYNVNNLIEKFLEFHPIKNQGQKYPYSFRSWPSHGLSCLCLNHLELSLFEENCSHEDKIFILKRGDKKSLSTSFSGKAIGSRLKKNWEQNSHLIQTLKQMQLVDSYLLQRDFDESGHHIQLAKIYAKESELAPFLDFFHQVLLFFNTSDQKAYIGLYQDFEKLLKLNLSPALNFHSALFLLRITRFLKRKTEQTALKFIDGHDLD
ncbi:MAG: hypothetical protein ACPGJV_13670, partial [Bacteriovoracaceae bacterium]